MAEAITQAEADGQKDLALPEFLIRRPIRTGKVDGQAEPAVERILDAALLIDARSGFAYRLSRRHRRT